MLGLGLQRQLMVKNWRALRQPQAHLLLVCSHSPPVLILGHPRRGQRRHSCMKMGFLS